MGQQQLLVVILVTILVAIALVVGMNVMQEASRNANLDAVQSDLASMATAAQGYFSKPAALGGAGNDFSEISWKDLGSVAVHATNNGEAWSQGGVGNANGEYTLGTKSNDSFIVNAYPSSGGDLKMIVCGNSRDFAISEYAPEGGAAAPACPE